MQAPALAEATLAVLAAARTPGQWQRFDEQVCGALLLCVKCNPKLLGCLMEQGAVRLLMDMLALSHHVPQGRAVDQAGNLQRLLLALLTLMQGAAEGECKLNQPALHVCVPEVPSVLQALAMCVRRLPPDALKAEHFDRDLAVYEELASVTVCCVKSLQILEALQPEEDEKLLLKPWHVDALVTALQVILACVRAMGARLEQVSIIDAQEACHIIIHSVTSSYMLWAQDSSRFHNSLSLLLAHMTCILLPSLLLELLLLIFVYRYSSRRKCKARETTLGGATRMPLLLTLLLILI